MLFGASTRLADELGTRREGYEATERRSAERDACRARRTRFAAAKQHGHDLSREDAIVEAFNVIDALTEAES